MKSTENQETEEGIPFDLFLEILSRSSLQTIYRLRLVSNECNSVTQKSSFMDMVTQRTKIVSGFIVQSSLYDDRCPMFVSPNSRHDNRISVDFLPVPVHIVASADMGLLLGVSSKHEFYVCKPCTKEWRKIPNPKLKFLSEQMGMIVLGSKPLHYKIVRFSERKTFRGRKYHTSMRCEVFDSDTWTWKELEDVKLNPDDVIFYRPSVTVCGYLHWMTKTNILAFDPINENHFFFPMPEAIDEPHWRLGKLTRVMEYEGKLGFIKNREERSYMELWVTEDYNRKGVWNKRLSISLEGLKKKEPNWTLISFYRSDVILLEGLDEMLFYNIRNHSLDRVSIDRRPRLQILPFLSDFEVIDLDRSKTIVKGRGKHSFKA